MRILLNSQVSTSSYPHLSLNDANYQNPHENYIGGTSTQLLSPRKFFLPPLQSTKEWFSLSLNHFRGSWKVRGTRRFFGRGPLTRGMVKSHPFEVHSFPSPPCPESGP